MSKTKKLTLCALLTALSTVLVLVSKAIPSPWLQGGSVTIASMVPIIAASLIIDYKYGILSGVIFALIQMMTGFYPPPARTFTSFFLVVMLDYILAFGVLGIAGIFYTLFRRKLWAIPLSGFIVASLRYVCHILSGLLIWGVYAENTTVLVYSLLYNGSYMLPEIIVTTVVLAALSRFIAREADKN